MRSNAIYRFPNTAKCLESSAALTDVPPEIRAQIIALLREVDDEYEITDMAAMVSLIVEHGKKYPSLYKLMRIDNDAVVAHFRKTGEVIPGIQIVQTSTDEGELTKMAIFRGPLSKP